MKAFRLSTLKNGKIDLHARVSDQYIKPEILITCQTILSRLRAGEESVSYPEGGEPAFDVRLGLPAWMEWHLSEHDWNLEVYQKYYFHLSDRTGKTLTLCLALADEDDDEFAADMVVPVFVASIPGHVPCLKHSHRTCWNVAVDRPVMVVADIEPKTEAWKARLKVTDEFCLHMAAAMLEEPS